MAPGWFQTLNSDHQLWYLRLACLSRLRLFNQTSVECTNLFSILNAIEPPESKTWLFDRILPFELEVMYARLKYWAGDHMGYLDALNGLLRKTRMKERKAARKVDDTNSKLDPTTAAMWKERGARISLIIASQLVEMKVHIFIFLPNHLLSSGLVFPGFRRIHKTTRTLMHSITANICTSICNRTNISSGWIYTQGHNPLRVSGEIGRRY